MASQNWESVYANKLVSARDALARIRSGQTVFIAAGAAEPVLLVETLADMAPQFADIEIFHLTAARDRCRLADPALANSFRHNTFYRGRGVSAATNDAPNADYTPLNVAELPRAMADRVMRVDVTLVQVSPPDELGMCSLGISVEATSAAVEHSALVIAQVNEKMPVTMGESMIPVESIDLFVKGTADLLEVPPTDLDPVSLTIGRHVASLITDGMTLHFDRGRISAATLRYLDSKKDLGIHTDILTDDIMRMVKTRAVTNRLKQVHKGRTVATMALGSRELYAFVDRNPYVEFHPIDRVNDPFVIAQNDNMVCIHSVQQLELSGLARVDDEHVAQIRSLPSSMDFVEGAMRSRGGFNIMALPSTSPDGLRSRIVALSIGRGAAFFKSRAEFVVTEYGIVNLYGLSIRERAIALISIAHPKFRHQLLEEAKRFNYVADYQTIAPESGCIYPHHLEHTHTFADGTEVFFRPVRPEDARRLQRLFYSLSPESIRLRYHGTKKTLPDREAQKLAAVDYSQDMAIIGLVGRRGNSEIIGEGRYTYNPGNNMGEFDIVARRDFRGRGVATFLANYLNKIAYSSGLSGMYAEVIQQNRGTMALLNKAWPTAEKTFDSGTCTFTVRFPEEDVKRPKDSIVVYSGRFGDFSYGKEHPFSPDRARVALRTIAQEGYLNEPWIRMEEPRMITRDRLVQSHDPNFIDALERANSGDWSDDFVNFNLGGDDCPVFPGVFDYVLLYTSATATAVDLIIAENANLVFNPLGGFHHASRSHAEGFCYINDILMAIDTFLAGGYRVAYIDIDAHHGNGVQDAYYEDDRVLFVSLHESGKTLYPGTGFETETGEEIGKGFTVNIPLPVGIDDEIFEKAFDLVITPAVKAFAPTVVVAVIGADTHKQDPLANLKVTNNGMANAVERIREYSNRLVLLGGGGYDTQTTAKAWCRMWGAANRIDALPDCLLVMGGTFLGGHGLDGADIVDMTYRVSGKEKSDMMAELERIAAYHKEHTIPVIGHRSERRD